MSELSFFNRLVSSARVTYADHLAYRTPFKQARTLYWKLHNQLFPQQRWLMADLPKHWIDKSELIPTLLYRCLEHFWIDENGEASMRHQVDYWQNEASRNPNSQDAAYVAYAALKFEESTTAYNDLKAAFEWSRIRMAEHSKIYDGISLGREMWTLNCQRDELRALYAAEDAWAQVDDAHLMAIMRHRGSLWT